MSATPASSALLPVRKRTWRRRGLLTLLILLFLICGFFAYFNWLHDRELREVIAETDRSDPNWRLADLEAQRAVVRDAENSAFQIQKVKSLIPANWPYWDSKKSPLIDSETLIFLSVVSGLGGPEGQPWRVLGNMAAAESTSGAVEKVLRDSQSDFSQLQAHPRVLLDPTHESILRAECQRAAKAITQARQLVAYPYGRNPIPYLLNPITTPTPWIWDDLQVEKLLLWDVLLRCQDGDLVGAITSCHAMLNVSRSLGDEPMLMAQLMRATCRMLAAGQLERVLAQGEVPEETLARMQHLLEEDESKPLLLYAFRGERAMRDQIVEAVQQGRLKFSDLGMFPTSSGFRSLADQVKFRVEMGSFSHNRAVGLRRMNRLVEIMGLPPEQQQTELNNLQQVLKKDPPLAHFHASILRYVSEFHVEQARQRCLIGALAVERYRRANGRWPESLSRLVSVLPVSSSVGSFRWPPAALSQGRRRRGYLLRRPRWWNQGERSAVERGPAPTAASPGGNPNRRPYS